MPRHDLQCTLCGTILLDRMVQIENLPRHDDCGGPTAIYWSPKSQHPTSANPAERTVVWENPLTGEVRYPGRNDLPIPTRYKQQGFQRKELSTLRDIEKFEKQRGVRNQKAWYDGSGRDDFGD